MALGNALVRLGAAPRDLRMTSGSALRPCVAIAGSVLAFALLIERAGFLAAVIATVLIAALAAPARSVRAALILAVVVAAAMAALFIGVLDQSFVLVAGW